MYLKGKDVLETRTVCSIPEGGVRPRSVVFTTVDLLKAPDDLAQAMAQIPPSREIRFNDMVFSQIPISVFNIKRGGLDIM